MEKRTKDNPWQLKTPPLTSEYEMHFDEKDGREVIVCTVGKTVLLYDARCITDLHEMLKAHGDWMIGGGLTLRFFRPENSRPVASRRITDPGGPNTWPSPYYFWESNVAAHGEVLYWADYAPKSMALPEIPGASAARMLAAASAGDDPNGDGRSDELDLLFRHRGDASLPVRATPQEANDGSLRFRLQADPGVPPGMDLWFEVSTDLNRWDALLQWRQESPGWRDAAGILLEISADGSVGTEHRSEEPRIFFRTRVARR